MSEHDSPDFPGQQLRHDRGRGRVGKMAVPRLDALLHRPGPMRIGLQQFLVVVRLDHERLHLAQPLDREPGGVAEIGHVTERARARRERCSRPARPRRAGRKNFRP